MTYPCQRCNRDDGYPICAGDDRCQRTDGAVLAKSATPLGMTEQVARVKAKLVSDADFAKALLPNMTHAEVKAMLQKRPT